MRVDELLRADRFAARLGARLVEEEPDRLAVEMEVTAHHRDASGALAAGALFSLADCALSLISNSEGAAVAVATHFTRAAPAGDARSARAVARRELPGRGRPATWHISLMAEEVVIASFTGTTLHID